MSFTDFTGHVKAATVPTELADAVYGDPEIGRYSSGNYRLPHGCSVSLYDLEGFEVFAVYSDAVSLKRT